MTRFKTPFVLLTVTALLLSCASPSWGLHEPPAGAPQFRRAQVESPPDYVRSSSYMEAVFGAFGTMSLPLREAVESLPQIQITRAALLDERLPLRDAVEKVPIWSADDADDGGQSSDSVDDPWGPFKAEWADDMEEEEAPLEIPYIGGNTYQKIVEVQANAPFYRVPSERFKVLCYVTNWAFYRKGDARFVPEQVDASLCSHVVYAYAALDPDMLLTREFDPWADIDNSLYSRITSLEGPEVLLGLGGWTDSAGDKYSRLVRNGTARRHFASQAVAFLRRYGFRGLQIDWNYPVCWQSDCEAGPTADKPNFTKLLQELRKEFDRHGLLLGVAVSGYKEVIAAAYDLRAISQAVDYMSVMAYDFHGSWETRTGHVSPLYPRESDTHPQYNSHYAVEYLTQRGAARDKMLLGVPFYGQTFTLARGDGVAGDRGEGSSAAGAGEAGEFTRQPGMLSYYEVCHRVRNQRWTVGRVDGSPHASNRDQWVGYEDPTSVMAKADYVVKHGLAGAAAWTIDLDDFNNKCCFEPFPLLRALNRALGRLPGKAPSSGDCSAPPPPVTPVAPVLTTAVDSGAPQHDHTTPSTMTSPQTSTHRTTWPAWNPTTKPTTTHRPPAETTRPTRKPTRPTTTRRPTTRPTTTREPVTRPTTTREPETRPTTTRRTTTSRRPTAATDAPLAMDPTAGQSCSAGTQLPHSSDCSAYYRCVLGELRKEYCAGGLHYNRRTSGCDWPKNADCASGTSTTSQSQLFEEDEYTTTRRTTTRTTTTRRSTTTRKPTRSTTKATPTVWTTRPTRRTTTRPSTTRKPAEHNPTSCSSGQYYEHEKCDKFYICVNGHLLPQSCAPGLLWNPDAEGGMCDFADRVGRCKRHRKRHAIHFGTKSDELDECEGNEHHSYPGDCSKYLLCQWGKLEAASCAPGLHWNQRQGICDWPMHAKCTEKEQDIEEEDDLYGGDSSSTTTRRPKPIPTRTTTHTTIRPKPTTGATTVKPRPTHGPLQPLSGHFKMVCYFTNWAWYRKGAGRYMPEDIDPELCTHIVYGFAVLDYSTLTVKAHDSWADYDNKFYSRVVAMKEKGVNVSLALGGWNDSLGDKYSRLVNSPTAREKFVSHVTQFIEKHGFDGLDLDWEYPVCWQVDCKKGPASDKQGFTALVRELSAVFKPRGWLLSTAVSPSKTVIDAGYEVAKLAKYFDWIAVMTYDFHGQWDKKTGHVAPLFYHPDDEVDYFNANFSLNYWIEKGAPARKIIMGMPLYGQSFTLSDAKNNGLNAKAPGPGKAGGFTKAAGFLAYYEICDRVKNQGWTIVQDKGQRMGPYAYKGDQWVSYDDEATLRRKAKLVRQMGLGGGMIWALDLDDFRGTCGDGPHPLLRTIRETLRDPPKPADKEALIIPIQTTHTTAVTVVTKPLDDQQRSEDEFKVVCYFTNWAWYRQGGGKFLPSDIDSDLCTHVVYGFAVLDRGTLTIKPHDSWADIDNKFYEKVVALKSKGIKVTIAIGGWNDSLGDKYSRLVNSPTAREKFVSHVTEFIEKYGFDGLDLDWEYPVCWQVDCKKGPASDKEGFTALVRELSAVFKPRGLLLSTAVSPAKKVIEAGYEVAELSELFDWISVMTYDYHGQWDKKTGHVAPMYVHPEDSDKTFNANYSINYWIDQGADRRKIIMGMPLYGQSFSLADNSEHGFNAATYGGGEAGDSTRARGFLAYYEICKNIRERDWNVVRDRRGRMGPYAYKRDQWVSFDDVAMIRHKSEYTRAMGLGGAMVWALDLDDFRNRCDCEEYPLLRTINRVLRDYPGPAPHCLLETSNEIEEPSEMITPTTIGVRPESATSDSYWKPTAAVTQTTARPQTTEADDVTAAAAAQACKGRIFAPHHADCNKYYLCTFGAPQLHSCPSGLHWNHDRCDWPHNSDCSNEIAAEVDQHEESDTPTKPPTKPARPTRPSRPSRPSKPARPSVTSRPVVASTPQHEETIEVVFNPSVEGSYKVVCYFTNWAWYRQGEGKYTPDDIDTNLCTHIVYGFAVLDTESLTIKPHDTWADFDNKFYERVVALKAKGVKVSLAIGGWNDSLGDKYSRLVNNPTAREKFVRHVTEFIEKHGFDGLDLDWEYPVCWQVDCTKGADSDKQGFSALVRELSRKFRPRGLLLSSAVSPSKMVIDAGYDVPTLASHFDWIAVMTYDFHGHWDKKTGHVAPLYYYPGDTYDYFNANFSLHYWIEQGTPARKLIMGMPLYGQSFTLSDVSNKGLNADSSGRGEAGEFTRAGGFLAFYEICERIHKRGWNVVRDSKGRVGPYAHHGTQWVSYDDVDEIKRKSALIKELGLGGGMVWALDLDDFRNRCGCGKHPLLKALNQELRGHKEEILGNCT